MEKSNDRLLPLNLQFFAEDGNSGDTLTVPAGAGSDPAGDGQNNDGAGGDNGNDQVAQVEQMKAELVKLKSALDKATHEASENKKAMNEAQKQLKAKMTQEEIDAANKREAEEKAAQELEDLRRKVARAESTKSVMSKLSIDEETAGSIAECLAGCEDIENALLLIQKCWEAKEKKLKLEYGKIPAPGAGGGNEDKETQAALELAKELGKRRAKSTESVRAQLGGLVR